jgi:hypothetical protein
MIGASLYIIGCSARNRLRRRLARLREPRYLIGAVVGVAYLWFSVFGRLRFGRRSRRNRAVAAMIPLTGAGLVFGALGVYGLALVSLLLPFRAGLLDFSRTESEFLFASPLSRRQLLLYRMLRSQWAVLFGALIMALTYPLAGAAVRIRGFVAAWLFLITAQAFFTGIALTRQPAASARARLLAWLPRLLIGAVGLVIGVSVYQLMVERQASIDSAPQVFTLLRDASQTGLPRMMLWPFEATIAPLTATTTLSFLLAFAGAAVVYLVILGWVLSLDQAFDALSDSLVEAPPRGPKRVTYRARQTFWTLALEGRQETPFIWKTVTQSLRVVSRRLLIRIVLLVGWLTVVMVLFAGRARGLTQVAGLFAAFGAVFSVVFGPQMLRLDLRQDLQHLELLKTWPVRVGALIRGQLLGPTVVITVVAWAFGLVALALSTASFPRTGMSLRLSAAVATLILTPAVVLAQYTVHNAAALFFPAWIATGTTRQRGVDAMGQRIIMLGGTWLVLVVAVLPSALVGAVLWFAFARLVGPWILIPAALIGVVLIAFEVGMATEALGPVYERLDVTSVERAE